MSRALKFVALLVCLCVTVPALHGQGKCNMQTITGTYAFYSRGSSSIVSLSEPAPSPFHWAAAIAPLSIVGKMSFAPDGTGEGFYWANLGSLNGGLAPAPFYPKITEMNEDCTALVEYSVTLPGAPPQTVKERFILLDNGREFRSIASQTPSPTAVWATTARRISRSVKPLNSCGPQTSHGVYVLRCEGYYALDPTAGLGFGEAAMFRIDIGFTGDYTGTVFGKIGPLYFESQSIYGTYTVNPDCSASGTLQGVIPDATAHGRGVFFEEGKEFYWIPIVTDVPGAELPSMPELCQGTRIDR